MNLLNALAKTSSMTMLSRVLGLARDVINARTFGANAAFDAFAIAFLLPNMFRRVFAEGAFSQAFVPILAEYRQTRGDAEARRLLADVAGWLSLALLVLTVLGVLGAPVIVWLSASGFADQPDKFDLTVQLTRITFPYILLISLSSLAGSVLNTWGRFVVPAFTPTLLNVSMIAVGLLLSPYTPQPIMALAIAVTLGGVLQLCFQLPFLAKLGLLPRPRLRWGAEGVGRVIRHMLPALFGVSVTQISLLLNRNFASHLPDGSMSWLYYADRLMELPTGVLGVALGTVLLPSLSRLSAAQDQASFGATLDWGLRLCWLLALPATVALAVIGEPIIVTLFQYGAFSRDDAHRTALALSAYAVGLMALISIKILAPAFYARQDIRTPVKVGVGVLLVTQGFNLLLIGPLGHAGLALSISFGAWVNALALWWLLRRRGYYQPSPGWSSFAARLGVAVGVMALALAMLEHALAPWSPLGMAARVVRLIALVLSGGAIYGFALLVLGFRVRDFRRRV